MSAISISSCASSATRRCSRRPPSRNCGPMPIAPCSCTSRPTRRSATSSSPPPPAGGTRCTTRCPRPTTRATPAATPACTALRQKLTEFKVAGQKLWDFSLSDLAEALKSMMFVASDPPALIGMGFLGASSLYDNIFNKIKTNDGQEIAKDKLDKIDTFNGELADLAKVAVPIGSAKDNQLSQIVLTSLDTIDQFVSRFTEALGEAATGVIDDIKDYRDKIDAKNDLMIAYNTQLLQLAKEFDAYQAARDKQIALDQKPDQLTKDMVATTMHYGSVYLSHLLTTANAVSWLRRAYAYTTLGAVPENNYVGDASLFWDDPSQLNDSSL